MIRPLRDVFVPLILCSVAAFLPVTWVVTLFIVMGYPHYLLGYIYRYRAKPADRRYLVVAPFLIAVPLVLYLTLDGSLMPLFLLTGLLFSIHFATDEFFLHGDAVSGWRWFTLASFIGLYSLITVSTAFEGLTFLATYLPFLFLLALGARLVLGGKTVSSGEKYLAFVACLILFISFYGSAVQVLAAVIFLHLYNWYDWSALRSVGKPGGQARYWQHVALSILLFVALFGLYEYADITVLSVFYDPLNYYAWSVGHILLSIRWPEALLRFFPIRAVA